MTETTLSKLQNKVDKQSEQIIKYKDAIAKLNEEKDNLKNSLKYYKDNIEKIVQKQ